MDESATGSVNFFGPGRPACCATRRDRRRYSLGHAPADAKHRSGVQSFLWSLLFFLILYFGMLAVGVAKGTSFLVSLVSAFLIFLFVRTRGA